MSITWIDDDEKLIGVWGYSPDSFSYIPAFSIWDIEQENIMFWFAGPEPEVVYNDGNLYSWDPVRNGVSIWYCKTGEQLYHNDQFKAYLFHCQSKTWISFDKTNNSVSFLKIQ